ncbi:MAG: polymer-forming cytoskeletal protein [bacterium]
MLTIFRTQQKDRGDSEHKDGAQQPDTTYRPPPAQTPSILPPKQVVPDQTAADFPKNSSTSGSTTIGKDLVFEGSVKGSGSIRVEGVFQGTLEVQNEVIIGKGGVVKGDIRADIVTVEGELKGNVEARQKITINVTGTMLGDIIAPRVVVASGAVYKGRIDMEAASKKHQPVPAEKSSKTQPVETKVENTGKSPDTEPKRPEPIIPNPPPKK